MKKSEIAVESFNSGMNCSQSVFTAFCEEYGIEKGVGMKLSCGFGGGVRCGEVCGAVSGGVLSLGLKYGNSDSVDIESKELCNAKVVLFTNKFKERNNSIVCKELLGFDISTDSGNKEAKEQGLFKTKCVDLVRSAVELLEEDDTLLGEN